ncbi:ATP-binding protein [Halalkalibacter kiskunsagensis]|uniref:histidine kinase n=1 Tax=Halalkalibacter kiskunsagensis TaxID=1548599 RepID=A0ABV6KCQ6_9BACI
MKMEFVKLNEIIELSNGGHILYVYEDIECYVDNAVSYIVSGIEENHHLIVIDSKERYLLIEERLKHHLSSEKLSMVHYINNFDFYRVYGDFHTNNILLHFQELIDPFFNDDLPIRTWAHVDWKEQSDIDLKLKEFEDEADSTVNDAGLVSVCAYPANSITVSLHMNMMRNHEYLMTDKELIRSSLYEHSNKTVIFPSLSVQSKLQSEMDLYKQKLDFVHVVSHEVRNPLTVIKAYCSVIMKQESGLSKENLLRMRDIHDYVDVIDHEMNHIIQTEQMLSKDLLWKKEIIDPLPVIREVIEFMSIKARTQHQILQETVNIKGSEQILANKIGLKLVLSNLLSNAIKYSEERSVVSFCVSSYDNSLIIQVKDQGIGMSMDQVNKLFKKYGKVNPDKSGSGIGLYMVKKLVDQFKGDIHIDSQLGRGTDVIITFPLSI